jgi:acylphosphatase
VEVLACGESQALDRLAEWLRQGPAMAKVQSVSAEAFYGFCPDRFTTG